MGVVQAILVVACALAAIVVLIQLVRNVPASNVVDGALAVVQVVVIAQLIAGLASVGSAPHSVSKFVYVGYLVGALVVLPFAWLWAQAERSRSGLGVLLVGLFVVAFLVVRLHQIWPHHG